MKRYTLLWPEGKTRALTFSYDDGVVQDRRLIARMNECGLKGTFNLNSGFLGWQDGILRDGREIDHSHIPPEEVAALYAGHEVAAHSVSHPDLMELPDPAVLQEILDDRRALEALVGYPVCGMAYPFGPNDERLRGLTRACGMRYARGVRVTHGFQLPQEPLDWACSCHHWDLEPLIDPFLEDDGAEPKLLAVWGHSYEFDQRGDWTVIENQLRRLGGHSSVWYAVNRDIFDYIAAFRGLQSSVDGCILKNPSALRVWLRCEGQALSIAPGQTLRLPDAPAERAHFFRVWRG